MEIYTKLYPLNQNSYRRFFQNPLSVNTSPQTARFQKGYGVCTNVEISKGHCDCESHRGKHAISLMSKNPVRPQNVLRHFGASNSCARHFGASNSIPKMWQYPTIVISDFYRHSPSVTPNPIICPSLHGPLSVCPAIKAYISVTICWILMKFSESVGS